MKKEFKNPTFGIVTSQVRDHFKRILCYAGSKSMSPVALESINTIGSVQIASDGLKIVFSKNETDWPDFMQGNQEFEIVGDILVREKSNFTPPNGTVIIPSKDKQPAFEVVLNPKLLSDAMKVFDGKFGVHFLFYSDKSPVILIGNEKGTEDRDTNNVVVALNPLPISGQEYNDEDKNVVAAIMPMHGDKVRIPSWIESLKQSIKDKNNV